MSGVDKLELDPKKSELEQATASLDKCRRVQDKLLKMKPNAKGNNKSESFSRNQVLELRFPDTRAQAETNVQQATHRYNLAVLQAQQVIDPDSTDVEKLAKEEHIKVAAEHANNSLVAEEQRLQEEERTKIAAEEQARAAAEQERAKIVAEEQAKIAMGEQACAAAEQQRAKVVAEEQAKIAAEEQALVAAEQQCAKVVAEEQAKIAVEEQAHAATEQQRAKVVAEEQAKIAAEEQAHAAAEQERTRERAARILAAKEKKDGVFHKD
jgi:hypothetical protein